MEPAHTARRALPSGKAEPRTTAGRSATRPAHVPTGRVLIVAGLALLAVNLAGASYFLMPLEERVRSASHEWFRPSGWIGQSAGLLALLLFLFLWFYPLRKRVRALSFTGSLGRILDLHITAGLLIPGIAATHAGWRFTGLIGLGYAAMFIVVLSGIAGRYIYGRIPRSRDGVRLSLEEIRTERIRILGELCAATGIPPSELERILAPSAVMEGKLGLTGTVRQLVADDVARRAAARSLSRSLRERGGTEPLDPSVIRTIGRLARRQMALDQQARLLEATQRVFRFWHVAHLPVAITGLLAVLIHVGVAVAMGATWFY
jgi:hypothetical protein